MLEIIVHFFYGDDCDGDEGSAYLCLLARRGVKMMFMWRILRTLMMVMIVPLTRSAWPDDDDNDRIDNDCDDHDCDDHIVMTMKALATRCSVLQEEV